MLDVGRETSAPGLEDLRRRWLGTIRRAVGQPAAQAIAAAGPASLRRRKQRDHNGRELPVPNAAEVELSFRGELRQILGPPPQKEEMSA